MSGRLYLILFVRHMDSNFQARCKGCLHIIL